MFKNKVTLLLLLTIISVSQSYDNNNRNNNRNSRNNNNNVINLEGSQNFTKSFYNEIIKDPKNYGKSFIYSPYSIQSAGALLYAGAGGDTADEILKGFNFHTNNPQQLGEYYYNLINNNDNNDNNNKLLNIANKIYLQNSYNISPKFKDLATQAFHSDIENINFDNNVEASNIINNWVEKNTNEKIKNFIKPEQIGVDLRLFLLNAIHFKGYWNELFNKNHTIKRDFYVTPDHIIQWDTMKVLSNFNVTFTNDLGLKAIDIPFKNSDLSLFLVSSANKNESLDILENKLNSIDLKNDLFDTTYKLKVNARIPKFKIEYEINMEDALKNLGMKKMFSFNANFQNFLENSESLTLSKAIHKAVIEINEEGAEAAAATAHGIRRKSGPLTFSMDQSFIFFIKNIQGYVYFMGRFTGE